MDEQVAVAPSSDKRKLSEYEQRFLQHFTPEERATLLRERERQGGSFRNFSRNGQEYFYYGDKVTTRWQGRARGGWSVRKVRMYRRVVAIRPDLAAQVDAGKLSVHKALQMAEERPRLTREAARMERAERAVSLLTPKQRQQLRRRMDRMGR